MVLRKLFLAELGKIKMPESRSYARVQEAEHSVTTSKFLSLEAFRGLAALMIVLYHSSLYSGHSYVPFVRQSDIFVDFFFILSGFVMAYSYLDKIGSKVSFRKFILLRFGRLYPLHLFTLLLWVPYIAIKIILYERGIGVTDPSESNNLFQFISNLFLLQAVDGYQPLSWNYPSWSISTEFYTYIVFFLFVLFISRVLSLRINIISILAIVTAVYALTWILDAGHGIELFLIECIGGFFLGILIYLLYRKIKWPSLGAGWATIMEVMSLALLVYCVMNKEERGFRDNIFFYVSIVSFACVIYVFVLQETGYISRLLKNTVFQFIGKLSYSIYMVHAIVLAGIENLFVYVFNYEKTSFGDVENMIVFKEANYVNFAVLLIVIFFSAFTYQYVEVPWRERSKKLAAKF